MLVRDLSEAEILQRIVPGLPRGEYTLIGSGDDCAQVSAPAGNYLVTTDVLVEGQHFKREWMTGAEVGARAVAQNLADVAAMGARPSAVVVSLVIPPDLEMDWLEDMARGIGDAVRPSGAGVVGGDITAGQQLVVSVTAHGTMEASPVTRSGAKPGDVVAVAGTLGYSAAGLASLMAGAVDPDLHGLDVPFPYTEPVAIYRVPNPPLDAGPLAAQGGARAMMDVSDGLAMDAGRIAKASDVSIHLDLEAMAGSARALQDIAGQLGEDPMSWVLYGGEDHSLLATFPGEPPAPFRRIGTVGIPQEHQVYLAGKPVQGGWDPFN